MVSAGGQKHPGPGWICPGPLDRSTQSKKSALDRSTQALGVSVHLQKPLEFLRDSNGFCRRAIPLICTVPFWCIPGFVWRKNAGRCFFGAWTDTPSSWVNLSSRVPCWTDSPSCWVYLSKPQKNIGQRFCATQILGCTRMELCKSREWLACRNHWNP